MTFGDKQFGESSTDISQQDLELEKRRLQDQAQDAQQPYEMVALLQKLLAVQMDQAEMVREVLEHEAQQTKLLGAILEAMPSRLEP